MTTDDLTAEHGVCKLAERVLVFMVPVPVIAAGVAGNAMLPVLVLAALLGGAGVIARQTRSAWRREVIATALIGQSALFTAALAGHAWQIDSHMMFFALLAVVSTMRSVPALILACAVTAVHHLSLSFLMPALVYPSADLAANLARTVLHGAIVVIEGAILTLSMLHAQRQRAALVTNQAAAEALACEAEAARLAGERAGADTDLVVETLSKALERLAAGDLHCAIAAPLPAAHEALRQDFNTAVAMLSDSLGGAVAAAADVHREAAAIADAAGNVASRVEGQAQDVTEVARALSDLAASLSETADGVHEVSDGAAAASRNAAEAATVVRDAIGAMALIETSSGEISSIIQVIDDISFQTSLLALNAGIEAARAGEAGKSFAVVASEVRALAQSTSNAARDIKTLIQTSAGHVANGADLVARAGSALDGIGVEIDQASHRVATINQAARAQSEALSEMNGTVARIDQSLQTNAALAEEMSAMGSRMARGAGALNGALSGFVLQGDAAQPLALRARAVA
ncbi:methyl-accepting chemotaxis protein [Rhodovulum euryhalinum]|uniref:Methyl-accepting chemotaxis sensory transducer n=1 Tax=Rhodovulum euryhalinum TaxID=35805 RepID=A0A4R2KNI2_9RHOB|nr:methyl-accepting chemotaxis protein [Rhodovulum euryhalinum]TCO72359.1 methyl-accepting chemotaxis sensory transducer [Rhodovulum euryhalinum]